MTTPPKYEDLALKVAELERREAALLEELKTSRTAFKEEIEGVKYTRRKFRQERDALQQRLAVAEQRAADLKKLICDVINDEPTGFAALKVDLANRVNDALKPAAEGEGS